MKKTAMCNPYDIPDTMVDIDERMRESNRMLRYNWELWNYLHVIEYDYDWVDDDYNYDPDYYNEVESDSDSDYFSDE